MHVPQFKKLSGSDLTYDRVGDSGKTVHYRNCAKCATVMAANADAMPGMIILKGGTVDDPEAINKNKPGVEIYTKDRPEWCTPWSIAAQKEAGA